MNSPDNACPPSQDSGDAARVTSDNAVGPRRSFGRCVHYVGFRDDRFMNAYRVWGGPAFVHRWWDKRAAREIGADDVIVFAVGEWRQEPKKFNAPDLDEADAQC